MRANEARAVFIDCCTKVKANGWTICRNLYKDHDKQRCCPFGAVAIIHGDDHTLIEEMSSDFVRGFDGVLPAYPAPYYLLGQEIARMFL